MGFRSFPALVAGTTQEWSPEKVGDYIEGVLTDIFYFTQKTPHVYRVEVEKEEKSFYLSISKGFDHHFSNIQPYIREGEKIRVELKKIIPNPVGYDKKIAEVKRI